MAEEQKKVLEQDLNDLIDKLDRQYFRKMQVFKKNYCCSFIMHII